MNTPGPYVTREQALTDITPPIGAPNRVWNRDRLIRALYASSAGLAAFDDETVTLLAETQAPETVQTVIGWIERTRIARDAELHAIIKAQDAQIADLKTKIRHAAPIEFDPDAIRQQIMNGGV